ncbi:MAG: hypothetical protein COU51_00645 [Parcubacteria group bacterium CG10_big_fil_rev_8_21_14_0_10_36_14]|nr:MAG: hypothetical protein COU51_00645 [Parcubacteria group bacterium CG10_big_fil_rev_8_21_14_0_10_36_14]
MNREPRLLFSFFLLFVIINNFPCLIALKKSFCFLAFKKGAENFCTLPELAIFELYKSDRNLIFIKPEESTVMIPFVDGVGYSTIPEMALIEKLFCFVKRNLL